MSQLLESRNRSRLYQDLLFPEKTSNLDTLAVKASCYVCGKGLEDGYSVTAKNTTSGIILYCDKHYS
jgi:hypothetical protein